MKFLFQSWGSSLWAFDFIKYDILSDIKNLELEYFTETNLELLLNRNDLINNNILAISCPEIDFNVAIKLVETIKPLVLFLLKDEHGNRNHWNKLANYTKLMFKEHYFQWYNNPSNSFQLPIGYATGYLNQQNSSDIIPKKIKEKTINCSFIGKFKQDREEMCNIFQENMTKTFLKNVHNDWDVTKQYYLPSDVFNIYNDSIFVLSGRGYHSLDCFRIYEAIIAGAIPVLIGDQIEINNTFNYNNNVIPFIYCKTWDEAVKICNDLLQNYDKLQELQDNLLLWWEKQLLSIKEKIYSVII